MPANIITAVIDRAKNYIIQGRYEWQRAMSELEGIFLPPRGSSFPTVTEAGELFLKEDELTWYRRNDANDAWESLTVDQSGLTFGVVGVIRITPAGVKTGFGTDLVTACSTASAGDVVLCGPGSYEGPITIPANVQVRAAYGVGSATLTAAVTTGTRVTLGAQSTLQGFVITCPTDATPGILIPATGFLATVSELVFSGQGAAGIAIKAEASSVIDRLRYAGGPCDTIVDINGNATVTVNSLLVLSGAVGNCIRSTNGGICIGSELYTSNSPSFSCTNGVLVEDGQLSLSDSYITKCTNGLHVTDDSAFVKSKTITFSFCTTDLLVDSVVTTAEVRLTGCQLSVDKIKAPAAWLASGNSTIVFEDSKQDDEGLKIFGELQVGLPEQGRESVFGEGDSYTRGMIVLTTDNTTSVNSDGGNFVDVTAEATSADGSTFTFQGPDVDYSILVGCNLSNNTDRLKFFGNKIKQSIAAVVDAGGTKNSFVTEYWNGSAWVEMGRMTSSSGKYYRYSNEVFLRANSSEHLRFGLTSNGNDFPWALKTINGQEAYWMRYRIKTTVLTVPTFEQFKLSSNRMELNATGHQTAHGSARWRKGLLVPGNVWGESGGVGSNDVTIGQGGSPTGWDHNVKNSFLNGDGDAVYVQIDIEEGVDTALPIYLKFDFIPNATSTGVIWRASLLPIEKVGVLVADPSGSIMPIARTEPNTESLTSKPAQFYTETLDVVQNKLYTLKFGPFNISDYYWGDQLYIRFELNSRGAGIARCLAMGAEIIGSYWSLGKTTAL